MQSKLEIACAALFEEVISYLFNICHQQNMLISFFFFFGRKGFCCCASILIYILALEKRWIKCAVLKLKDSSLQDTKALQQSSTILYFRVSSRGLDSIRGTPGGHHLEPPDLKLQTSGALESRSDLNFPLDNFQWTPSIFFFCFQKLHNSVLSLFTSYIVSKVSHVHKHRKSSA